MKSIEFYTFLKINTKQGKTINDYFKYMIILIKKKNDKEIQLDFLRYRY